MSLPGKIKTLVKRDSFTLGIALALLLPALALLLMAGVHLAIMEFSGKIRTPVKPAMVLISIFLNLILMRYYLVSLKMDRTGRGILLLTFVEGFLYFLLVDKLNVTS